MADSAGIRSPSKKQYLIVGTLTFLFGLIWNFPLDRIQSTFTKQIEKQTGIRVSSQKISFAFPFGLKLTRPTIDNLRIGSYAYDFQLDQLKITLDPISAITFALLKRGTVAFDLVKKDTTAEGKLSLQTKSSGITLKARNISFDDTIEIPNPDFGMNMKIPLKGTVDFDGNLSGNTAELMANNLVSLNGKIKLNGKNIHAEAPIVGTLDFAQLKLDGKIEKSLASIATLQASGPQISFKGSGTIELKPNPQDSIVKLDSTLTFGEAGQTLKSLVSSFGSAKGIQVDSNGVATMKIVGTIARPDVTGY